MRPIPAILALTALVILLTDAPSTVVPAPQQVKAPVPKFPPDPEMVKQFDEIQLFLHARWALPGHRDANELPNGAWVPPVQDERLSAISDHPVYGRILLVLCWARGCVFDLQYHSSQWLLGLNAVERYWILKCINTFDRPITGR